MRTDTIICAGDLTADHIGKFRLVLTGEGDWTAAIPVRVHSPVVVTP